MSSYLIINPGATSTKLALFEDETEVIREELTLDAQELQKLPLMLDQFELRRKSVEQFIEKNNIDCSSLDMIVCRGGSMNGVNSGAYAVDEHVLTILEYAPRTQHASSLACFIGHDLSKKYGIPIIFYDSPSASDAEEVVHYTGLPGIKRWASDHCLNSRAVARECARRVGKELEEMNFIVAHLGGGITVSFVSDGRIVDAVSDDECQMSPQRAGRIPSTALIDMCYSGEHTKSEVLHMMRGGGGLVAYLGVHDAREVLRRIEEGDTLAYDLFWSMAYGVSKAIGEMSVVHGGKVDRIILTGGMAYSEMLTDWIRSRVEFIAPVEIIPGEREMLALARGGMRVMNGEEPVKEYRWLPKGCRDLSDVKTKYGRGSISILY